MKLTSQTASCLTILAAMLLAFFCAPSSQAADEAAGDGTPVGVVPVPDGLSITDVKACVARAFISRKYQVRKSDNGLAIGYYERGPNVLTLTVRYDTKEVKLFAKGGSRGGGLPTRWIENYRKDLNAFLGRKLLEK